MAFIEIDIVLYEEDLNMEAVFKAMIDMNEIESFSADCDKKLNPLSRTLIYFKSGVFMTANISYPAFKKLFQVNATKYIAFKN